MGRFLRKQMEDLFPVFLGEPPDLPALETESQMDFIEEFMAAGAAEFKLLYIGSVLGFKSLSSVMSQKPWSKMSVEQRQAAANRLYNSRNPLMRSLVVLSALPLNLSYYHRDDVAIPLGFDRKAWKAEAMLRSVSRDRSLPAKEGSA